MLKIKDKSNIIVYLYILLACVSFLLGITLKKIIKVEQLIKEYQNDELKTLYYTDMDTCVLYMTNERGISVMLDKDSKVMLDQECLLSKEGVDE